MPRSPRLLARLGDERLVDQTRRGNDAAFVAIYDRHSPGLLSFCRYMLGSQPEAEDALQQTFTSAYAALRSDARELVLKPWLYTIARNRCLSMLRARREQPVEDADGVSVAGLPDEIEQRADLRELVADLEALPDRQREALVLSELADLPHAEIAQILGCEPKQVKALVFQARSALIETRRARDVPCAEIREELATARGAALRRGPLRRHLQVCEGCAEFRDQVRRQRRMMAAILPVVPTVGLKESALAAAGVGAGIGGGSAAAGGGGLIAALGSHGAAKVTAVVLATGGAIGGVAATDGAFLSGKARGSDQGAETSPAGSGTSSGVSGDEALFDWDAAVREVKREADRAEKDELRARRRARERAASERAKPDQARRDRRRTAAGERVAGGGGDAPGGEGGSGRGESGAPGDPGRPRRARGGSSPESRRPGLRLPTGRQVPRLLRASSRRTARRVRSAAPALGTRIGGEYDRVREITRLGG